MTRIQPVDESTAAAGTVELLDMVRKKMGTVPNLISTMANSPATAKAYLGYSQALSTGSLSPRLREQIALAVSEINGCGYCLAAHTMLGKGAGLSEQESLAARRGTAGDARERAAVEFAAQVVRQRGRVSDADVERVREAGYTAGEVGEIVANVALHVLTNYFNTVAGTEVDFPAAPPLAAAA